MRRCPVSGEEMTHETIHGVTVDRSPHGVWLDKGEFFQITERAREDVNPLERVFVELRTRFAPRSGRPEERGEGQHLRDLPCPVSGEPMALDTYEDVYIDRSPHGVWLDKGELELIIERLKADPHFLDGVRLRLGDMEL